MIVAALLAISAISSVIAAAFAIRAAVLLDRLASECKAG